MRYSAHRKNLYFEKILKTKRLTRFCPVIASTPTDTAYFFGYHDLCPWNSKDDTLALIRVEPTLRRVPDGTDVAEICLWQPESGIIKPVADTRAWNWQQGARLQWLPNKKTKILYNDLIGDRLLAVILDLSTGAKQILPFTVSALSSDGRTALSPHFGRLARYWPAYGYAGTDAPGIHEVAPAEDGLWRMDLVTKKVSLLFSLAEIVEHERINTPAGIPHFVAHPSFNPAGTRFVFMHRFMTPDGALYSRLMTADSDGCALRVLAVEKVSHFDWYDDDTILVWARFAISPLVSARSSGLLANPFLMPLVRFARKLAPGVKQSLLKEYYFLIKVDEPAVRWPVGEGVLKQDGHPMFSANKQWLLTDTYPDKERYQALILFEMLAGQRIDIGRFHSTPTVGDGDIKCDLHPRWNNANTRICVDSTNNGVRQCLVVDPTPILEE